MAAMLAIPALLTLVGCGSSGAGSGGSSGGTGVNVEAQDFMFSPASITAKSGDKVTVTINNTGSHEHNFSISELGVSQDVEKGETKTVTFTASGSSNLRFFCKYHKARGMTGTVDLGGANSPASGGSAAPSGGGNYSGGY